jgi:hypothetical protein
LHNFFIINKPLILKKINPDRLILMEEIMTENLDLPVGMFRASEQEPKEVELNIWKIDEQTKEAINVPIQALVVEVDGKTFFEGDIYLGSAEEIRLEEKSIGIAGANFRWEFGQIPFVINGDDNLRQKVGLAKAHWEKFTPIRLLEITAADEISADGRTVTMADGRVFTSYVSFENQGGCFSAVGRRGGRQVISLGDGCTVGSAIHEIGHTVGLFHEQSRADRDNFIKIIEANINPIAKHNFKQHIQDANDLGEYDFGSIMHYPATAFSINGKVTIETKNGDPIGQRKGLSKGDVAGVKIMYPNLAWTKVTPVP